MPRGVWFYVAKNDNTGFTDHGIVTVEAEYDSDVAEKAFEQAVVEARDKLGPRCPFTIITFNKVS